MLALLTLTTVSARSYRYPANFETRNLEVINKPSRYNPGETITIKFDYKCTNYGYVYHPLDLEKTDESYALTCGEPSKHDHTCYEKAVERIYYTASNCNGYWKKKEISFDIPDQTREGVYNVIVGNWEGYYSDTLTIPEGWHPGMTDGKIYVNPSCTSNSYTACYNNDVYWYDSCGNREGLIDGCNNYCYGNTWYYSGDCSNGDCYYNSWACNNDETCDPTSGCVKNCYSHDYSKCYNGERYWYDSCDNREGVREYCADDCINDQCCDDHAYSACYNNERYWYDSCGNREGVRQYCSGECHNDLCYPITISRSPYSFSAYNPSQTTHLKNFLGIDPVGPTMDDYLARLNNNDLVDWANYWNNVWTSLSVPNTNTLVTFTNNKKNQYMDPYCGDGTCDSFEDCGNCAVDCGACPTCNQADCDANDYYYCGGNYVYKADYNCVSGSCTRVANVFVTNCPYGCISGECNPEYPKTISRSPYSFTAYVAEQEVDLKNFLGIDPPGLPMDDWLSQRTNQELLNWESYWVHQWVALAQPNTDYLISFTINKFNEYYEPCGDGTCDSSEDCNSCPSDCGACEYCGDGVCNNGESCSDCPNDCAVSQSFQACYDGDLYWYNSCGWVEFLSIVCDHGCSEGVCIECTVDCPSGWTCYKDACYLEASNKQWLNARDYCTSQDGYLVTINDQSENDWLVNNYGSFWLGINDREVEGSWEWVGEDSSFTYWNTGEPNNAGGEDCVHTRSAGNWNDISCTNYFKTVCEYGIINPCPNGCNDFNSCTTDYCGVSGCVYEPLTPCCGNGVCEASESCESCPTDCLCPLMIDYQSIECLASGTPCQEVNEISEDDLITASYSVFNRKGSLIASFNSETQGLGSTQSNTDTVTHTFTLTNGHHTIKTELTDSDSGEVINGELFSLTIDGSGSIVTYSESPFDYSPGEYNELNWSLSGVTGYSVSTGSSFGALLLSIMAGSSAIAISRGYYLNQNQSLDEKGDSIWTSIFNGLAGVRTDSLSSTIDNIKLGISLGQFVLPAVGVVAGLLMGSNPVGWLIAAGVACAAIDNGIDATELTTNGLGFFKSLFNHDSDGMKEHGINSLLASIAFLPFGDLLQDGKKAGKAAGVIGDAAQIARKADKIAELLELVRQTGKLSETNLQVLETILKNLNKLDDSETIIRKILGELSDDTFDLGKDVLSKLGKLSDANVNKLWNAIKGVQKMSDNQQFIKRVSAELTDDSFNAGLELIKKSDEITDLTKLDSLWDSINSLKKIGTHDEFISKIIKNLDYSSIDTVKSIIKKTDKLNLNLVLNNLDDLDKNSLKLIEKILDETDEAIKSLDQIKVMITKVDGSTIANPSELKLTDYLFGYGFNNNGKINLDFNKLLKESNEKHVYELVNHEVLHQITQSLSKEINVVLGDGANKYTKYINGEKFNIAYNEAHDLLMWSIAKKANKEGIIKSDFFEIFDHRFDEFSKPLSDSINNVLKQEKISEDSLNNILKKLTWTQTGVGKVESEIILAEQSIIDGGETIKELNKLLDKIDQTTNIGKKIKEQINKIFELNSKYEEVINLVKIK